MPFWSYRGVMERQRGRRGGHRTTGQLGQARAARRAFGAHRDAHGRGAERERQGNRARAWAEQEVGEGKRRKEKEREKEKRKKKKRKEKKKKKKREVGKIGKEGGGADGIRGGGREPIVASTRSDAHEKLGKQEKKTVTDAGVGTANRRERNSKD